VTSFFDHDAPFLTRDPSSSITTYWGRSETDIAFAYDGHDGWDYALAPPDMALAAADGQVIFAGNADDGCATRAVILDHGNGYRTLYWHLFSVDVEIGQSITRGQALGMIGASGCATGPHLHFGVQFLGRNTDPYGWCGAEPDPWGQHPAGMNSTWLWADRPSPCMPPPADAILVDTDSPGFARDGDGWQTVPVGYGGSALFVPSTRGAADGQPWELRPLVRPAVAVWQPELPAAGRYRVLAYLPYALSGLDDALNARYRIRYSGGEAEITVNVQERANDWIDLGTYQFAPGDKPSVALSSMAETDQRSIWVDAILWLPADQP
jgi:murein DD-endopeptidase MepM/ murein hydrolase activator NlpD